MGGLAPPDRGAAPGHYHRHRDSWPDRRDPRPAAGRPGAVRGDDPGAPALRGRAPAPPRPTLRQGRDAVPRCRGPVAGRRPVLRAASAGRTVRGRARRHPLSARRAVAVRPGRHPAGDPGADPVVGHPGRPHCMGDPSGPAPTRGLATHRAVSGLADDAAQDLDGQPGHLEHGRDGGRDRLARWRPVRAAEAEPVPVRSVRASGNGRGGSGSGSSSRCACRSARCGSTGPRRSSTRRVAGSSIRHWKRRCWRCRSLHGQGGAASRRGPSGADMPSSGA